MRCSTFVFAIELVITLPNDTSVFGTVGVPYFGTEVSSTITAAELVIRTGSTTSAGIAGTVNTRERTSVGRIGAAGVLVLIESIGRDGCRELHL